MPGSNRNGLWMPGAAVFHSGLGCALLMSHHYIYRSYLHNPIQILAGKIKMELLPTPSYISLQLHKRISSSAYLPKLS